MEGRITTGGYAYRLMQQMSVLAPILEHLTQLHMDSREESSGVLA
jgi:hypothetical protein